MAISQRTKVRYCFLHKNRFSCTYFVGTFALAEFFVKNLCRQTIRGLHLTSAFAFRVSWYQNVGTLCLVVTIYYRNSYCHIFTSLRYTRFVRIANTSAKFRTYFTWTYLQIKKVSLITIYLNIIFTDLIIFSDSMLRMFKYHQCLTWETG